MHTTCVLIAIAESISSGMLTQRKRIQESSQHMPIATVRLDDDQAAWVESQTTRYRKKADVIRDLIDTARQGLTGGSNVGAYSVGAGDQSVRVPAVQAVPELPTASETAVPAVEDSAETKKKSEEIEKAKKRFVFSVPEDLTPYKPALLEYWREYKTGRKSEKAAKLLITGIRDLLSTYGDAVVREQIELACAGNWRGITVKGYEQYGLSAKKGYIPAQPDHKHPAYRDASEVIAESERLAQQNVEHLRRKAAEAEEPTNPILDALF